MSKGSGRRRISPADGLRYNEETQMTKEIDVVYNTLNAPGAPPTANTDYGSHSGTGTNGRYGGKGRKNDYRSWKNYTRGKQYEKPKPDDI